MSVYSRERSMSIVAKIAGPLTGLLLAFPGHKVHAIDFVTPLIIPPQASIEEIQDELKVLNQGNPKDFLAWTQMQVEKAEREEEERREQEYWSLGPSTVPQIKQWENIILSCSKKYNLNPKVVAAVMMVESKGNPRALSEAGAVGLMQVMGGSWNPEINLDQGCKLLSWGLERFGKLELALASYNAGPHRVVQFGGVPPYKETHKHIELTFHYMYLFDAPEGEK